jgi:hypothetical protein
MEETRCYVKGMDLWCYQLILDLLFPCMADVMPSKLIWLGAKILYTEGKLIVFLINSATTHNAVLLHSALLFNSDSDIGWLALSPGD